MKYFLLFLLLATSQIIGQERIDGTIAFQDDPAKQYSIYVPSEYDENSPSQLMLGLHPWNVNRWNSISWCDTLIAFAESRNLLLVCPDGGEDGQIDDPIDQDFTTAILDSMTNWYNVDENEVYAMGFSWGGKTTYTYCLNHIETFAGLMPIGAAINGTDEIEGLESAANDLPVYIIHGDQDTPDSRYYPLLEWMQLNGACVESNLLEGVPHTIDFDNRDEILREGFDYLVDSSCGETTTSTDHYISNLTVFPNPIRLPYTLNFSEPFTGKLQIVNMEGREVLHAELEDANELSLPIEALKGVYVLKLIDLKNNNVIFQEKLLVD